MVETLVETSRKRLEPSKNDQETRTNDFSFPTRFLVVSTCFYSLHVVANAILSNTSSQCRRKMFTFLFFCIARMTVHSLISGAASYEKLITPCENGESYATSKFLVVLQKCNLPIKILKRIGRSAPMSWRDNLKQTYYLLSKLTIL